MGQRRQAGLALAAGLALVALVQLGTAPRAAPLFDGVFLEDPYLFVDPPPGAAGDPLPVQEATTVVDGAVPLIAVATPENPPQAQLIAQEDAFLISVGTTSVIVSIEPLAPDDPLVAGNVYRFSVTDEAGAPLQIRSGTLVTVVLRAPQPLEAQVARLDGSQWVTLSTEHGGLPDLFAANIEQLGDFAVIGNGDVPTETGQSAPVQVTTASPAASAGSGGASPEAGTPTWLLALFAIAAVAIGLGGGLLRGARRR